MKTLSKAPSLRAEMPFQAQVIGVEDEKDREDRDAESKDSALVVIDGKRSQRGDAGNAPGLDLNLITGEPRNDALIAIKLPVQGAHSNGAHFLKSHGAEER